jgi:hypothetical protein
MIDFRIDQAKALFLDRAAILKQLDADTKRRFVRFGGSTRLRARRSMKPVSKSQLKKIQEKRREVAQARDPAEKRRRIRELIALQKAASAKRGQPPKAINRQLRDNVFFVYDPANRSVIIGPVRLPGKKSGAPEALEKGGDTKSAGKRIRVAPHPYMLPAFNAALAASSK